MHFFGIILSELGFFRHEAQVKKGRNKANERLWKPQLAKHNVIPLSRKWTQVCASESKALADFVSDGIVIVSDLFNLRTKAWDNSLRQFKKIAFFDMLRQSDEEKDYCRGSTMLAQKSPVNERDDGESVFFLNMSNEFNFGRSVCWTIFRLYESSFMSLGSLHKLSHHFDNTILKNPRFIYVEA